MGDDRKSADLGEQRESEMDEMIGVLDSSISELAIDEDDTEMDDNPPRPMKTSLTLTSTICR